LRDGSLGNYLLRALHVGDAGLRNRIGSDVGEAPPRPTFPPLLLPSPITFVERAKAWLGGSRDSGTRARQSRAVRAPAWNGHGIGGAAFASECKAASAWPSAATVANSPIGFLVAEHAGVLIVKIDLTGIGPVSQTFPFGSEQPRSAPLKVAALRTAQTIAAEKTDRSRTDLPLCMPLSACVADSSRLQRRA
jgi:hypothetical protein